MELLFSTIPKIPNGHLTKKSKYLNTANETYISNWRKEMRNKDMAKCTCNFVLSANVEILLTSVHTSDEVFY